MAEKKSEQDPAKAAFLAALEKKKTKGVAQSGGAPTDGQGSAKGAQSGVTRRIERRRSGSS